MEIFCSLLEAPAVTSDGKDIPGRTEGQQAVRDAIITTGLESLKEHYGTKPDGVIGES